MNNQYSYQDAFDELQTIVSEIERGEISVDELSEKVKRAALLIDVCNAKLTSTEKEVNDILASLTPEPTLEQPLDDDAVEDDVIAENDSEDDSETPIPSDETE